MTGFGARLLITPVTTSDLHTILSKDEGPAAEVINGEGTAPICLVCEHASAFFPATLDHLGVADEYLKSHAAWDIGGLDLALAVSRSLDAPLVVSRVSRLVYDCNRPPSAPDAIPEQSEVVAVPGNVNVTQSEKDARVREVYEPFRDLLAKTLDGFPTPPVMVTIHSFTPVWHGQRRDVELGLLHDSDDRLAKQMLSVAPESLNAQLNAPYSVTDGVTHTLREHAIPRGLANVMIEVRNDLISDATGVARIADLLTEMLTKTRALETAT